MSENTVTVSLETWNNLQKDLIDLKESNHDFFDKLDNGGQIIIKKDWNGNAFLWGLLLGLILGGLQFLLH